MTAAVTPVLWWVITLMILAPLIPIALGVLVLTWISTAAPHHPKEDEELDWTFGR